MHLFKDGGDLPAGLRPHGVEDINSSIGSTIAGPHSKVNSNLSIKIRLLHKEVAPFFNQEALK